MSTIEPMKKVRKIVSLFERLRKEIAIPNRQPLLDYSFGWEDPLHLFRGERELIPQAINIWNGNGSYEYEIYEHYRGFEYESPTEDEWVTIEEDGVWVSLYTKIPPWLKEIGDARKKERQEIMRRKKYETQTSTMGA